MPRPISRRWTLRSAPAPVDNPLKGLVPYATAAQERFPHSLEFDYLPLAALVIGKEHYDWSALEALLNNAAQRGNQAVFRLFLEYPGKKNAIPRYLLDAGLTVHRYINTNTQPLPPTEVETPDYENPALHAALTAFIQALGSRYDGDPRIGYITAGLLGTWGEWHDYPKTELFASKTVQTEVLNAYEAAFRTTPVLLRYPAGNNDPHYAPNATRRFGYHDDSFAWATLDTGKPEDSWFYMSLLKKAGRPALEKWRERPIGGEIRPEAWGRVFDVGSGDDRIQNFAECVRQTHATWLMDSGMFEKPAPSERRQRAEAAVRQMGYELHISMAETERTGNRTLMVRATVVNRGVAPFYYDWPVEYALRSAAGRVVRSTKGKGKISSILPGSTPSLWEERIPLDGLPSEPYTLLLRVPNPMKNGKPLRFANAEQSADWLTVGTV